MEFLEDDSKTQALLLWGMQKKIEVQGLQNEKGDQGSLFFGQQAQFKQALAVRNMLNTGMAFPATKRVPSGAHLKVPDACNQGRMEVARQFTRVGLPGHDGGYGVRKVGQSWNTVFAEPVNHSFDGFLEDLWHGRSHGERGLKTAQYDIHAKMRRNMTE